MKKLAGIIAVFVSLSAAAVNSNPVVNEKVQKTFEMVFANAQHVTWRSEKDNNEASFSINNIRVRAVIDNSGQLVRTIRYYGEENLPASIRYGLKKKFDKEEISSVSELSANDQVVYYITLKDKTHLLNLVVNAGGNIVSLKKYKRGDL
ncbi:hypothetical protein [Niabella drilacis]|uniref:Beta-lactamase-inhibitor-like, PepSY-like n=1 Tax=Niabella drilacis (strain DSM 25811 / CCM 8410 / CCUG 62505 / LMG 26954 / E90) TaxID=1285928 RepID=A0A1G7AHR7_NIADE|nr:hypothetical protein [Niabella drilacis]SDE14253.1 hypothetical protein SAMN04487894_12318 [Niabella drilacis]